MGGGGRGDARLLPLTQVEASARVILLVSIGPRMLNAATITCKMNETFPSLRQCMVQLTQGNTHRNCSSPCWLLAAFSREIDMQDLPVSMPVLRQKSKSDEGTRFRCASVACPFRAHGDDQTGNADSILPDDNEDDLFQFFEELDGDDEEATDATLRGEEADEAAQQAEELAMPAKRGRHAQEVWPFAYPEATSL